MKIGRLFLLSLAIVGCAKTESNWLVNPKPKYETYNEPSGVKPVEFDPKAEIIFVMDNSKSMDKHITDVSTNIDKFVDAFSRNNPLTYNLAVVSVYDSRTYHSKPYQEKWGTTDAYTNLGQFRQVKSSATELVPDKYFISSSDENLKGLLSNTLKVKVQDLPEGGPQIEESFSPLAAIYNFGSKKLDESLTKRQSTFFMGKSSYKIIFFVTDATDATADLSASELYYNLVAKADGDVSKVMAFAAIVPSSASKCARDPGNLPYKIEEFLKLTRKDAKESNVVSLCDSSGFGDKFAQFGKSIRERVMGKVIPLENAIPYISTAAEDKDKTLRIFYGDQEIPFETSPSIVGYKYDPASNSVKLNPNLELMPQPNAQLRIHYTSVKATR